MSDSSPIGTKIQVKLYNQKGQNPITPIIELISSTDKHAKLLVLSMQDQDRSIEILINDLQTNRFELTQLGMESDFHVGQESKGALKVYTVDRSQFPYSLAVQKGLSLFDLSDTHTNLLGLVPEYILNYYRSMGLNFIIELPERLLPTADRNGLVLNLSDLTRLRSMVLRAIFQDICLKVAEGSESVIDIGIPGDFLTSPVELFGWVTTDGINKLAKNINNGDVLIAEQIELLKDKQNIIYILEQIEFKIPKTGNSTTLSKLRENIANGKLDELSSLDTLAAKLSEQRGKIVKAVKSTYKPNAIFTEDEINTDPKKKALRDLLQRVTDKLFPELIKIELCKDATGTDWRDRILGLPFIGDFYLSLPDSMDSLTEEQYRYIFDLLIHELTHVVEAYLQGREYKKYG